MWNVEPNVFSQKYASSLGKECCNANNYIYLVLQLASNIILGFSVLSQNAKDLAHVNVNNVSSLNRSIIDSLTYRHTNLSCSKSL